MNFPVPIPSRGGLPFPSPRPNLPRPQPPRPPGKVPGIKGSSLSWLTPAAACALLGTNCALPFSSPYEGGASAVTDYIIEFKYKRRRDRARILRDSNNNGIRAEGGGWLVEWFQPGTIGGEITFTWRSSDSQILSVTKKLFFLKSTLYQEGYEIRFIRKGKERTIKVVLAASSRPTGFAYALQESNYSIRRKDGEAIEPWGGTSFNPIGDFILPTPAPMGTRSPQPPLIGVPAPGLIPAPVLNLPGTRHTGKTKPGPEIDLSPSPFPLPIPQPPSAPPEGNRDEPIVNPNPVPYPIPVPDGLKPFDPSPNTRDLIPTIVPFVPTPGLGQTKPRKRPGVKPNVPPTLDPLLPPIIELVPPIPGVAGSPQPPPIPGNKIIGYLPFGDFTPTPIPVEIPFVRPTPTPITDTPVIPPEEVPTRNPTTTPVTTPPVPAPSRTPPTTPVTNPPVPVPTTPLTTPPTTPPTTTPSPTRTPTESPTTEPTTAPTKVPVRVPLPTIAPLEAPTATPIVTPTQNPDPTITPTPTDIPVITPITTPTPNPTPTTPTETTPPTTPPSSPVRTPVIIPLPPSIPPEQTEPPTLPVAPPPIKPPNNKNTTGDNVCDPCIRTVQKGVNRNSGKINNLNTTLNGLNATLQGIDLSLLSVINAKLGPQVNGGLSGWLKRFSRSLQLDRVMNTLSVMLSLHNAAQLSRNLGDSLSYFLESGLQLVGIKDEDDNPIDINALIGSTVGSFVKGIVGERLYNGINEGWKKTSAIFTAAVQIYELSTNMMAGIAEGLELASQYTGKIGNALKKAGVVLEGAYEWMDENVRVKTGRLGTVQRVIDKMQTAEEVVSNLTEITEQVKETQDNIAEITEQFDTIKTAVKGNETAKKDAEDTGKTNSESPSIITSDLNKPN